MIIYAWQKLEGKKTDVLGLKTKLSKISPNISIQLGSIKKYRTVMPTKIQKKNIKQSNEKDGKAVQLHTRTYKRYYWKTYRIF